MSLHWPTKFLQRKHGQDRSITKQIPPFLKLTNLTTFSDPLVRTYYVKNTEFRNKVQPLSQYCFYIPYLRMATELADCAYVEQQFAESTQGTCFDSSQGTILNQVNEGTRNSTIQ